MKKITMIFVFSFIIGCDTKEKDSWPINEFRTNSTEQGQHLYMDHGHGMVTHRAKFNYARDCSTLRDLIQQKEPFVFWSCAGKAE
ncbi:hypothetical protein D8682_08735 [Buttiauxella sp. 3AFRM03]|uniref:hypothetical protein n=1 Tax=Buttiauxella sp. 3AFRM03 TaxID=2479367 RepID=UPI000EF7F1AA|nr:hypothetical protein [Buttiauxella sp. 3AFRM03]AYN27063.1 hypothetical protein D8682_08735 [Buttiauxella sp. 3AFRM03]